MHNQMKRQSVIIAIVLFIAILHIFNPFRQLSGIWHDLYFSYFSDLFLPFTFYFLLCIVEGKIQFLHPWWIKAGSLFALVLTAEILQYFGFYALGTVYDPMDILMVAVGIGLAIICDLLIFPKLFLFWED